MDGPFEITFGIELEFVVLFQKADYREADGHYNESEADIQWELLQHIVDVLKAYNFMVNDPHDDCINNWTVTSDSSIDLEPEDLPHRLRGLDSYPLELKSPAYRYTTEALTEVQRAVAVVKRYFKIFVNESCGFHVHVGNHDRGFTLETVKSLSLLVTVFERQLNQLHPRHRNFNSWCLTPALQLLDRSLWEFVEAIEDMPDIISLIALMCSDKDNGGSKYRAYNLCNLADDNRRTIEFRQHQGTIEAGAILAWIDLTCRLVSVSHDAGPAGFIELVKERADDPSFTVLDLLHTLGFDDLVRYYLMPYYSGRSISQSKQRDLWVRAPPTGKWLCLASEDEGSEGSQDENSYLDQLYDRLGWYGLEVTDDDVQIISATCWRDI